MPRSAASAVIRGRTGELAGPWQGPPSLVGERAANDVTNEFSKISPKHPSRPLPEDRTSRTGAPLGRRAPSRSTRPARRRCLSMSPGVASSASLRSRAESSHVATPRAVLALAAASTSPRPFRGARSRRAVTFDRGEERERVAPHACAGSSPKPAAPERPVSPPDARRSLCLRHTDRNTTHSSSSPPRPCPTCVVEHERRSAGGSPALSRRVAGDLHPRESARSTA